jgi:hypothetical protein
MIRSAFPSLRRPLALALAAACVLGPAAAARADTVGQLLTPQRRALIDPAQVPHLRVAVMPTWSISATRTGDVPGRPGNAHGSTLLLHRQDGRLVVDVTIIDEQCDESNCTQELRAGGTVDAPAGTQAPPGGTAHVVLHLSDPTPGLSFTWGDGVPARALDADVTITPSKPVATPALTLDNAGFVQRTQTTDSDQYMYSGDEGTGSTAGTSGDLFGITPTATDQQSVSVTVNATAANPGLGLVRTAAQRAQYLPAVSNGVPVYPAAGVTGDAVGVLLGSVATSSGHALPGNRQQLGTHVAGGSGSGLVLADLDARDCQRGEPFANCAEDPQQVALTQVSGSARGTLTTSGRVHISGTFGVAPQGQQFDHPQAWGTVKMSYDAVPGPVGEPRNAVRYYPHGIPPVTTLPVVELDHLLTYSTQSPASTPPPAIVRFGAALVGPPAATDTDALTYGYQVTGYGP